MPLTNEPYKGDEPTDKKESATNCVFNALAILFIVLVVGYAVYVTFVR